MSSQFEKAYTIKEVSKQLSVPPGTLRQWEKDLEGRLVIPRSKQGARFYTEKEINLLVTIKQMRDKNLSKEMIKELLQKHLDLLSEASSEMLGTSSEMLGTSSETLGTSLIPIPNDTGLHRPENNKQEIEMFMSAMESFKGQLIDDVRTEIRNGVRKEVLDEVKKEISKGSVHMVKSLSDSIYKSNERTKADIEGLSNELHKVSEHTSETLGTLTRRIAKSSKSTSEQIRSLAHRVADSSEAAAEEFKTMIHYISSSAEVTHTEISALIETLNTDREIYIESINREREEYWKDINQREGMFQDLIVSFRNAAAAEEKKEAWWKFWR